MEKVRPKKHLGQHFLKDQNIAIKIVESLTLHRHYSTVLEIGPGMGVLSQYLLPKSEFKTFLIDIDRDSVKYLKENYPIFSDRVIEGDFLKMDLLSFSNEPFAIIGNFPYNISSQIFFKVLENKDLIPEVVGMLQKEVAQRIASSPGNKNYGILSVFLQAYYDIEFLFSIGPEVFSPPPKVNSAVIRLKRNTVEKIDCDEKLFFRIVKHGFQNRRKTLRNALKTINLPIELKDLHILDKRAEQLSVNDFVELTKMAEEAWKKS